MRRKPQKGVYAFIDSQNLNVGVQKFGWKMDWKKFRQFLTDNYGVTKAYMFIGYVPEFESLYQQLHEAGYLIVLKPTFDMTRVQPTAEEKEQKLKNKDQVEKEDRPTKGNVDADLVLWAMKEIPHYSKAVIVSGDGDFYALIEYLDEQKKLLKLLAPNAHYSGLFNRFENYVERLDTYKNDLRYYDRHKKPRNNK